MSNGREVARWATYGGAVGVVLSCHYEGEEGARFQAYNAGEYTRRDGLRGSFVFNCVDDADAIARIEERIAAGYYTPNGSRHAPGRVIVEQRA
jgi:hypothetical protein